MTTPKLASYIIGAEQTSTSITLHAQDIQKAEMAVIKALSEEQLLPIRVEVLEPTLESLFMEVVK